MELLPDYSYVLVFFVIGIGFVVGNCVLAFLISPKSIGERSLDPYESGEIPIGSAWIRFDVYYYLFALLFLAFDVEAVFLFPVLLVYRQVPTMATFMEVALFLGILSFALLYAWKKEVFRWR